jgi:hypothetical protein
MNSLFIDQPPLVNRRVVFVGLLAVALIAAGLWARHQMMAARIQDIFAVGPLSPARAGLPSVVSDEQLRQIERREQELHEQYEQLQWEGTLWQSAMIGSLAAAAITIAALFWLLYQQIHIHEDDDFE